MPTHTVTAGRRWRAGVAVAVAVLALAAPLGPAALASTTPPSASAGVSGPAPETAGPDGRPRLHAVVLVDESGSETEESVRQQADGAGLIANAGQLDPSSQVAVVGFGTDDYPEVSAQRHGATSDDCPLAGVGSADFHTCLDKLHKRTVEEGNGTDHAAALGRALDILEQNDDPTFFNVIFLLTDGKLQVDNVQKYGTKLSDPAITADIRNNAAKQQVTGPLSVTAKRIGAQIWPLGFGSNIDEGWMRTMAGAGAGVNPVCEGVQVSAPSYAYAPTAADVAWTLNQVVANATCQGYSRSGPAPGGPGNPVKLALIIPLTASTATINAIKRDSRIKVAYTDPSGNIVKGTGEQNGSKFVLNASVQGSESLFILNPLPGTWTVSFEWPPGTQPQTVAADLTWLGQLNSVISLDGSPQPGKQTIVTVALQTSRHQPISDPELLKGLTFTASLSGDGFSPVPVPLADDGRSGDGKTSDGVYAGPVTIPDKATGVVQVTGRISGIGLRGTVQSASFAIPGARTGGVILTVDSVDKVHRGDTIGASIRVDNPGGTDHAFKLAVEGIEGVSIAPATLSVKANEPRVDRDLTLSIAPDAAYGKRIGAVQVINAENGTQLTSASLAYEIVAPPGWLERNALWLVLVLLVLVIAGLVAEQARRARNRRLDVSMLTAYARRYPLPEVDLPAPNRWAKEFRFLVRDAGSAVTVTHPQAHEVAGVITVRRAKHGQLAVSSADGVRQTVLPDTPVVLPGGLQVRIHDGRLGAYGAAPPGGTGSAQPPASGAAYTTAATGPYPGLDDIDPYAAYTGAGGTAYDPYIGYGPGTGGSAEDRAAADRGAGPQDAVPDFSQPDAPTLTPGQLPKTTPPPGGGYSSWDDF